MRKLFDLAVLSNLFFIIPLIIAIIDQNFVYILILIFLITSSTFYHLNKERKFYILDFLLATTLITYNFYSFYLSGYFTINFMVTLVFVIIGFYFYFKSLYKNYSFNHAIWHLCSSIITTIAILSI